MAGPIVVVVVGEGVDVGDDTYAWSATRKSARWSGGTRKQPVSAPSSSCVTEPSVAVHRAVRHDVVSRGGDGEREREVARAGPPSGAINVARESTLTIATTRRRRKGVTEP